MTPWKEGDDVPRQRQRVTCWVCGKPFLWASTETLSAPAHDANGKPCSGSGRSMRLVSAGMQAEADYLKNGKASRS